MLIGVTGATGFIGRELVEVLLAAGHEVRVLVRNPAGLDSLPWKDSVGTATGDLEHDTGLADFCRGCDAVMHLAALSHVTNTRAGQHERSSVGGTRHLLAAMKQTGCQRLVFASSIKASPDVKASAYARAKFEAENLVREATAGGLLAVILRPAVVYGPGMKGNLMAWMRRIRQKRAPRLPASGVFLHMVGRHDLCLAFVQALDQVSAQAPVWLVTDGHEYVIDEIQQRLFSLAGHPLPALALPRAGWWLAGQVSDLFFALTGRSPGFSSRSFDTLFRQQEEDVPGMPGFTAQDDFYSALPDMLRDQDAA